MPTETPQKIKPFIFHGVTVAHMDSENASCHCFSCGKEKHMNVSVANGRWRCLVCDAKGNIFSFLQQLHELCIATTSEEQLEAFATERRLTVAGLKAWGVCYNHLNDTWLIPGVNDEGKIINLYKCEQDSAGKWMVMNTPGCKITVLNSHNSPQKNLYVCEGPWDGIALWGVLSSIGYNSENDTFHRARSLDNSLLMEEGVVAFPGASSVPKDAPKFLKGKHTSLLYDNDHPRTTDHGKVIKPGWDGMMSAAKLLTKGKSAVASLRYLKWGPEGFSTSHPDGYDIKDLVNDNKAHIAYRNIQLNLETYTSASLPEEEGEVEEVIEPILRTTFADLCEDWKSKLFFPESLRRAVAISIATLFSTTIAGEQIWIRVRGQPGTGKTTLAEAIAAAKKYVKSLSMFTGFHSGFAGREDSETSLIPELNGKMLVIKDGDTLLTATGRDRILAELRDIYDGVSRAQYRTGKKSIHSGLRISIMICGTDDLVQLNRSSLGERFIDVKIIDDDRSTHSQYVKSSISRSVALVSESISNGEEKPVSNPYVKQCTVGYINYLKDSLADRSIVVPTLSKEDEYTIECMANYVAYMRAKSGKDEEGLSYKPRAELGTRLGAQFVKLGICLGVVLNKRAVDSEVLDIIYEISRYTTQSYRSDISDLLSNTSRPLTKQQIAFTLNIPETSIDRMLNEMLVFGIVCIEKIDNNSGSRGRKANGWKLTAEFTEIYREIRSRLHPSPASRRPVPRRPIPRKKP